MSNRRTSEIRRWRMGHALRKRIDRTRATGSELAMAERMRRKAITSVCIALAACGGAPAPGTRPHDMSVDEHFKQAREHSATAEKLTGRGDSTASGASWYPWYPWYYHWDPATPHHELAGAHARAGAELEIEVRTACADISDHDLASPLASATGVEQVERWVVFHLPPGAGTPDRLLARLRCERARMIQTSRRTSDATCLDGVVWTAHAGAAGVDLMATAPDAASAAELVRRARLDVR